MVFTRHQEEARRGVDVVGLLRGDSWCTSVALQFSWGWLRQLIDLQVTCTNPHLDKLRTNLVIESDGKNN